MPAKALPRGGAKTAILLAAMSALALGVTLIPSMLKAETAGLAVNESGLSALSAAPSSVSATGVADVTLTPASANFGSVAVSTASNMKSFVIQNSQSVGLSISSLTFTGSNAGDFAQTNTCGSSLAAGSSCTISVTFTPQRAGVGDGNLHGERQCGGSLQHAEPSAVRDGRGGRDSGIDFVRLRQRRCRHAQ